MEKLEKHYKQLNAEERATIMLMKRAGSGKMGDGVDVYGEQQDVGLNFIQPNLPGSLGDVVKRVLPIFVIELPDETLRTLCLTGHCFFPSALGCGSCL